MASKTGICNLALYHLGVTSVIANVETEQSREAAACRTFFETVRDATLADFPWPFATRFEFLGLETDSDDDDHPTSEYAYSYRYPSNCLTFRRILSGSKVDTEQTKVPYKISSDDEGKLIFTDREDAECEFTVKITDTEQFSPMFVLAMSFLLAYYIAPGLTAGDPFKLGDRALESYNEHMGRTKSHALNEEAAELTPEAEYIRSRDS